MRDSFHIGILRFRETWGASCLLIHANVAITHSMADAVSIRCFVRSETVSFRVSSITALYMWSLFALFHRQPSTNADGENHPVTHVQNLSRHLLSTYFILITCPLLHTSVSLHADGLWSCFSERQGYRSPRSAFNALDRWLVPIGSTSDEVSLRLPRPFFPYINSTSPSFPLFQPC